MAIKTQRTPEAALDDIPGEVPSTPLPEDVDLAEAARQAVDKLNHLRLEDVTDYVIWRDFLALQNTYRTLFSAAVVVDKLKQWTTDRQCSPATAVPGTSPNAVRPGPDVGWVDVDVQFTTQVGGLTASCAGIVSVIQDNPGQWRIWMLRTWMENFVGHGHPDELQPALSERIAESTVDFSKKHNILDVAIVGGGQCGLSMAGRVKALNLSYIIFDKNEEVGDSWAKRYDSLRWHTSTHYGHLPFGRTFSNDCSQTLPIKQIGAGFKAWAERNDIVVQRNSVVESAEYDAAKKLWTLRSRTNSSQHVTVARCLVLAIGIGHRSPKQPAWASWEKVQASGFQGIVKHAVDYKSCAGFEGRQGVVVGSANTGHDVAEDMANAGMETTIIQRNRTFVFPLEWLRAVQDMHYNEYTAPERADREESTIPLSILRHMANTMIRRRMAIEPERFVALEKAGFMIDWNPDVVHTVHVRRGGHYIDIGASERIAKGEIRVVTKRVEGLTRTGILFEDGTELAADLVVVATGFEDDPRRDVAAIVGQEIADQMDDYGGVDAEGERRGAWKLAGRGFTVSVDCLDKGVHADRFADERLWYHGGDVALGRFFSRFIALQIQSELLQQPL